MGYRVICTLVVGVLMVLSCGVAPAHATFPGKNGKIILSTPQAPVTINPDGTGRRSFPALASSPPGRRTGLASLSHLLLGLASLHHGRERR